MSAFSGILKTPAALLLLLGALLLLLGQTAVFLLSLREKKKWLVVLAALHLAVGFVLFVVLLDVHDRVNFPGIPWTSNWDADFLYELPWLIYAGIELASALILLWCFLAYRRYRKTRLTPDAIRQTIDLLPEGICVSAPDGTVLLSNLKMDALCRDFLGGRLNDAVRLWDHVTRKGEGQENSYLMRDAKEDVWLFTKETISIDGKDYDRLSAANVTARYRITEELREKNEHLKDIQRRMKEAAELSGELFVKQEEANARSALHNELGQVLLMGRHYLEHPDTTDGTTVELITRQMNRFLLGEIHAEETSREDLLQEAVRMAESIGVTISFEGDPPAKEPARSLLALAIRECAANAVKHAEADRLTVRIEEQNGSLRMTFQNNGKPPKGPIAESGGLLSLRRNVEAQGGVMNVQSLPRFSLTLCFPDE